MARFFFVAGCVLALLSVAAGAFGAHALEARLSADRLATWEIGARYQMYHALALVVLGGLALRSPAQPAYAAGWLFLIGVLVFSGTLYALALGGPRWLGAVTPLGGVAFMLGWTWLAWAALRG